MNVSANTHCLLVFLGKFLKYGDAIYNFFYRCDKQRVLQSGSNFSRRKNLFYRTGQLDFLFILLKIHDLSSSAFEKYVLLKNYYFFENYFSFSELVKFLLFSFILYEFDSNYINLLVAPAEKLKIKLKHNRIQNAGSFPVSPLSNSVLKSLFNVKIMQ